MVQTYDSEPSEVHQTVDKRTQSVWQRNIENGLRIPREDHTIEMIVQGMLNSCLTHQEIADELGFSEVQVNTYLLEKGLVPEGINASPKTIGKWEIKRNEENLDKIIELINFGLSSTEIVDMMIDKENTTGAHILRSFINDIQSNIVKGLRFDQEILDKLEENNREFQKRRSMESGEERSQYNLNNSMFVASVVEAYRNGFSRPSDLVINGFEMPSGGNWGRTISALMEEGHITQKDIDARAFKMNDLSNNVFRDYVLELIKEGCSNSEASEIFDIKPKTFSVWKRKLASDLE